MVYDLVERTAEYVGVSGVIPRESVVCFGDYVGPGYSLVTKEMIKTVRLLAETEGVLLDPVYTGKTMAGLIDLVQKGYFRKREKIMFLHTGGSPALYAYKEALLE